tara:strand:- start:2244 stop:2612 length:369 start_codon:yes stop_codon:yes gene_type:complete
MKKIIIITMLLFSSNGFADVVYYYEQEDYYGYYLTARYPADCKLIKDINYDYKNSLSATRRYNVKDRKVLEDIAYKCGFYLAGKTVSDGAKNTATTIKDTSKEIYKDSGAKSLIDGLFGKDD